MNKQPTPTTNNKLKHRRADFATITEALDYAAQGETGQNYYSARGELLQILSYKDLREQACDIAAKFAANGFQPGDRILLIADTEPEFVILFFACQYASLLPVPVAVPMSFGGKDAYISQLKQQIINCSPKAVWAPESLRQMMAETVKDTGLLMWAGKDPWSLSGMRDLRPWGANELSYLQFSSGSTRFPKGIDIRQKPLMANCYGITNHGLKVEAHDRATSWLPFYHDMGLVGFMLAALAGQTSIDYMATRDFARRPLTWLKLMADNGGTLAYSPSFGYELCVRRMRDGTEFSGSLASWRAAGIGGDMVQHHVLDRFTETFASYGFHRQAFVPSYGMAETVLAVSFAPLNQGYKVDFIDKKSMQDEHIAKPAPEGSDNCRGFVACGIPLPDHLVEIRNEQGQILTARQVGKIFVQGPSVMNGYFQQKEETDAVLSPDGWLDTGDLGYWWDNQIVITGRAKDLIIINGRNIWPQDLEWSAEELPGLRRGDIAAFSVDENGQEQIIILVQCRSNEEAVRQELIQNVSAQLQKSASVETKIVLVPPHSLPQTSSGKLSRAKAKANYLNGLYV